MQNLFIGKKNDSPEEKEIRLLWAFLVLKVVIKIGLVSKPARYRIVRFHFDHHTLDLFRVSDIAVPEIENADFKGR